MTKVPDLLSVVQSMHTENPTAKLPPPPPPSERQILANRLRLLASDVADGRADAKAIRELLASIQ